MLDLEAYLARIGLTGRPVLAELHRAHVTSIPFENLDPRRGIPVSLAPEDLERKLVRERRGGYCFEQNLLLGNGLEALGMRVEPLLARVRVGGAPSSARPRTHLVLRVQREFGTAIILITHDLGVVADMADDVVVMYGGQVMERAERRELFYRNHHPYT
ncbi:MAG: arylamine N-acetyltransferase, partial [Solirubrobacteraceae bacterium]